MTTLASIVAFKYMIDYLKDPGEYSQTYAIGLYSIFVLLRLVTIMTRSFYDLHVYNYFRFV